MKKLFYFSTFTLPNHRAHGVQIMKTCEYLSGYFDVTLIVGRKKGSSQDIYSYYKTENKFNIEQFGALKGRLKVFSDIKTAFKVYMLMKRNSGSIFYTRDRFIAFILSFLDTHFYCEIHSLPKKSLVIIRRLASKIDGIISTNRYKKDFMVRTWRIDESKILVAPNGVSISVFDQVSDEKDVLRKKLHLQRDKILIGFVGRFEQRGDEKGISFIFEAIKDISVNNVLFCLVGGSPDEIVNYKEMSVMHGVSDKVVFIQNVDYGKVPEYMKAMDYLFLAYKKTDHLLYHASSVKVFEYMASARPLIISRTPAIEEALSDDMVFYFEPEDKDSFCNAVESAIANNELAKEKALRAYAVAKRFDWKVRANTIAEFISRKE